MHSQYARCAMFSLPRSGSQFSVPLFLFTSEAEADSFWCDRRRLRPIMSFFNHTLFVWAVFKMMTRWGSLACNWLRLHILALPSRCPKAVLIFRAICVLYCAGFLQLLHVLPAWAAIRPTLTVWAFGNADGESDSKQAPILEFHTNHTPSPSLYLVKLCLLHVPW